MEPAALIVPTIASIALGGALLVPLRDDRHGRKATRLAGAPVKPDFRILVDAATSFPTTVPESKRELADKLEDEIDQEMPEGAPTLERGPDPADDDSENIVATVFAPKKHDAFAAIRNAVEKLRSKASAALASGNVGEAADRSSDDEIVIERSFAEELAILLPHETSSTLGSTDGYRAPVEPMASSDAESIPAGRPELGELETATTAFAADLAHAQPTGSRDREAARKSAIAITSAPHTRTGVERSERAVPLTRLPLRHAPDAITWPSSATPALFFQSEAERHAFLRSRAAERSVESDALMARAYREETPVGRTLALDALSRNAASASAIETFVFALATGSDQERAISVDALADAGARAEVAQGLSDRVDAIAAKAALAYVGTTEREDYQAALAPLIDEARIAAILDMLAGVIG